jgi:hypothetical protein
MVVYSYLGYVAATDTMSYPISSISSGDVA